MAKNTPLELRFKVAKRKSNEKKWDEEEKQRSWK